jgi:urease accessory protein
MYPGSGRITVSVHGEKAVLSELSSTYPLKLLSPHVRDRTAIVYLLTYGGGLVGGDQVDLVVEVQPGTRLVLLSQVGLYLSCTFMLFLHI